METFTISTLAHLRRLFVALAMILILSTLSFGQITSTTPSSRCGEGTLVLYAAASSGTIQWYTVPFYGSPIATGSSFTTPSLFVTTTYYVDAVDDGGCSLNQNQARIPVIATISANAAQSVIFYESNSFCNSVTEPQSVTQTGTSGGTFTAVPEGLNLNSASGAITPSSSNLGTYTVTYTVTPAAGCIENPATTEVTITTAPLTSTILYEASPYCTSLTAASVTLTNPNSGTFSATPSGLSINATTGQINPSLSLPGAYTVTYFVSGAGGCAPQTTTTGVTITGLPTAAITYTGTPFCKDITNASPTLTGTGAYTGGTYSATGLTVNSITGIFNPATTTAGTYTIYYTTPASGNCAAVEVNNSVTINPLPTAVISGTATVCQDATAPDITFTGSAGTAPYTFTYKINDGIDRYVTSGTGTNPVSVTVANSTVSAGTYEYTLVSVTDANGCSQAASGTATITVTPAQVATFSYLGSPFCKTGSVSPTFTGGGVAGTFTQTQGAGTLSLNSTTGVIDLAASDAGSYTITNTLSGCGTAVATYDIVINALPTATISGDLTACVSTVLTATTDATNKIYMWYKDNEVVPGAADATYTVTESGDYKVKVTNTDTYCEYTSSASTVTINPLPVVSLTGNDMDCVSTVLTAVHNAANPSFVWYKDDVVIEGQTGVTYTVTVTGNYKVKVTNGTTECAYTIANYYVTINPLPTATITAPDPNTVCIGGTSPLVTFTGAAGTSPYIFTYKIDDGAEQIVSTVPGQNSVTVEVPTTSAHAYTYTLVKVTDGTLTACNQTQSGTADVTIVADPTIETQPVGTTICQGGSATLSVVAANGTGTFSYQWQYDNEGWVNVSNGTPTNATYTGATTAELTVSGITGNWADNRYQCVITSTGVGCNTVTSATADVPVVADPVISVQPTASTAACFGEVVNLSVTATGGTGTFSYQWYSNTSASASGASLINDATTNTYAAPTSSAGTMYYYCIIDQTGNGCGSVTSDFAEVITYPQFTTGEIATTGETICYNEDPAQIGSTTAASGGFGTITYKWESSTDAFVTAGTLIAGATSESYDPPAGLTTTTSYRRYAHDATCNTSFAVSTGTWLVTVNPLPTITTTGTIDAVTTSASQQTTIMAYTASSIPVSYSIDWTGMADQTNTAIAFMSGSGSVTGIVIPANTAAGTYTGTMTIYSAAGCTSTQAVSVTVYPTAPTGSSPQTFCAGN